MAAQPDLWTTEPFEQLSEEVNAVVIGNDRVTNHLASETWLRTLTTCCLCGSEMDPKRRYLCEACSEGGEQ